MKTEEQILADTGGSAYPMVLDTPSSWHFEIGMTLRDYFAAQAMSGHIALEADDQRVAEWSYATADAMIAARSKPVEGSK